MTATTAQYYESTISVRVAPGRDIDALLKQYGVSGSAFHSFAPPYEDAEIAAGLDRNYRVKVAAGDERRVVALLATHPLDIEFAGLVFSAIACVTSCPPAASVSPATGPRGTTFDLRFCCWTKGTTVEKIFTAPSGKVTSVSDMAGDDETVAARWAGGPADEVGAYEVKVRGAGLAQILGFRIQ